MGLVLSDCNCIPTVRYVLSCPVGSLACHSLSCPVLSCTALPCWTCAGLLHRASPTPSRSALPPPLARFAYHPDRPLPVLLLLLFFRRSCSTSTANRRLSIDALRPPTKYVPPIVHIPHCQPKPEPCCPLSFFLGNLILSVVSVTLLASSHHS